MPKENMHTNICIELNDLYKAKNSDYGDSFSKGFKKRGLISVVWRLEDKLERLATLSRKVAKVKRESIRDTLIDIANYAILAVIEIDSMEQHELEEQEQLSFISYSKIKHSIGDDDNDN